jgi:hypothetical protein
MNIMMSESLKERVSIKNFEKQMSDRELSDNVEKTKVLKIERNNDKIILTLECDRQLLSLLYSYSIGLVNVLELTSHDLNLKAEKAISFKVEGCRIDYMDTVKKIKLTLKVE